MQCCSLLVSGGEFWGKTFNLKTFNEYFRDLSSFFRIFESQFFRTIFEGLSVCFLPVQKKNILRENNVVKKVYSFIVFGFWSEAIKIFAEIILQSCQNCIQRVKQKNLRQKLEECRLFYLFQTFNEKMLKH